MGNREAKYRIWDKRNNTMCEVTELIHSGKYVKAYNPELKLVDTVFTKDFELMQFIGIEDKNKNEMCEGDIIKYDSKYIKHTDKAEFDNCVIVYIKGGYYLETKSKAHFHLGIVYESGECERIGNIYENPELMEAKDA